MTGCPTPASGDRYCCFADLAHHERRARTFAIVWRRPTSGVLVMAPHGGGIEAGTSELAAAVAASDHGYYAFEGRRWSGNAALHLTSTRFDEPTALALLRAARVIVTIHGCRGEREAVYPGGLDTGLRDRLAEALQRAGFPVHPPPCGLEGVEARNLTNRGRAGAGVQFELTAALRRRLLTDAAPRRGPAGGRSAFERFADAVRVPLLASRRGEGSHCRAPGARDGGV